MTELQRLIHRALRAGGKRMRKVRLKKKSCKANMAVSRWLDKHIKSTRDLPAAVW